MNQKVFILLLILSLPCLGRSQEHLLISEFAVTPTNGEYIEIYNGTGGTVPLSNYYLADNASYLYIVNNTDTRHYTDFIAKFPDDASIPNNSYQIIALNDSFSVNYGFDPDYELTPSGAGDGDDIPDMLNAGAKGIGSKPGLTDSGESLILFYWDGQSDLVEDVDYVVWGDESEAIDKTDVSIDGPDPDSDSTSYANDTPAAVQRIIPTSGTLVHEVGNSIQRFDPPVEVDETTGGGNGITGHDETSENLASVFTQAPATPGTPVPVELVSFDVSVNGRAAKLIWSTATETNNHGFEIQRSQSHDHFTTIGFVRGNGTTSVPHSYSYTDESLAPGVYYYRLKQVDTDGSFEYSNIVKAVVGLSTQGLPRRYALYQNFPNPFNLTTRICFEQKQKGWVKLEVLNLVGQSVATILDNEMEAGFHQVTWEAHGVASGIYLCRIQINDFLSIKKLILIK